MVLKISEGNKKEPFLRTFPENLHNPFRFCRDFESQLCQITLSLS